MAINLSEAREARKDKSTLAKIVDRDAGIFLPNFPSPKVAPLATISGQKGKSAVTKR